MDEDRIHRAVWEDGTQIVGRVQGHGPPIVLVHGGLGDGEVSWRFMLPFLVDPFTCYMMSTRGRGLSGEHPDHSRQRHFEDVAAFVESIGEPAGVFGHSAGAVWALGGSTLAAAHLRGSRYTNQDSQCRGGSQAMKHKAGLSRRWRREGWRTRSG